MITTQQAQEQITGKYDVKLTAALLIWFQNVDSGLFGINLFDGKSSEENKQEALENFNLVWQEIFPDKMIKRFCDFYFCDFKNKSYKMFYEYLEQEILPIQKAREQVVESNYSPSLKIGLFIFLTDVANKNISKERFEFIWKRFFPDEFKQVYSEFCKFRNEHALIDLSFSQHLQDLFEIYKPVLNPSQ